MYRDYDSRGVRRHGRPIVVWVSCEFSLFDCGIASAGFWMHSEVDLISIFFHGFEPGIFT